jgi:hypothetical protein
MPERSDITVTLPAEYFDTLSVVISTGLKYAGINPLIRRELMAWWTAESEMIREDLNDNSEC